MHGGRRIYNIAAWPQILPVSTGVTSKYENANQER